VDVGEGINVNKSKSPSFSELMSKSKEEVDAERRWGWHGCKMQR